MNLSTLEHIPEHITTDPRPPGTEATEDERTQYLSELKDHVNEWCESQINVSEKCIEAIWCDFTCDFSEAGLLNLDTRQVSRIRNLLLSKGIAVRTDRQSSRKEALIECWESEKCPKSEKKRDVGDISNFEKNEEVTTDLINDNATKYMANIQENPSKEYQINSPAENNENNDGTAGIKMDNKNNLKLRIRSQGIQGLLKSFQGRTKYSGGWDEDLFGCLEIYEICCSMCHLTSEEKLEGLSVMLSGGALSYYATNIRGHVKSYNEAKEMLVTWFTSDEQRSRLLQIWKNTKLTDWFKKNPTKSQSAVFREMCDSLVSIQRQLDLDYRKPLFLRDQLISAADLPNIKRALKENHPKTAHDAMQRIALLLSDQPGTAGSTEIEDGNVFYGLGTRFGGQAERKVSKNNAKSLSWKRDKNRRRLARLKGCWVCGKDHFAHKFHSKEEVKTALNKHKDSRTYVSVDDVVAAFVGDDLDNSGSESDFSVESDEEQANFADSYVSFCNENPKEGNEANICLEQKLSNTAFIHSCGFFTWRKTEMENMQTALTNSQNDSEFKGVMIDTGANRSSLMSIQQYMKYCKEFNSPMEVRKSSRSVGGLGGANLVTIGKATIPIPFPKIGIICDVTFHIHNDEGTPSILSLRDLTRTGLDLSIQHNWLHFRGKTQKLRKRNDLLYYEWSAEKALISYEELYKLHRSFGHPSVSALYNLLKRARPREASKEVRNSIKEISKRCKICSELSSKPKRFKLTIGCEGQRFNTCVAMDVMYIRGKPVLHIVDEATHFAAAMFLRKVSSAEVWRTFLRCWVHVYLGPPDYLRVDQGSNFTSEETSANAEGCGIKLIKEPVECPNSMSHVERYHGPLRSAYEKLMKDLPKSQPADILQMAVHCVNNTMGPEGLCPSLCVFGALPRPARSIPAPTQLVRAKAMDEAMDLIAKEQAKRKLTFGLKYRGPFGKERKDLDNLRFGSPILIFRQKSGKWEGPFKFVSKENETVCAQLPYGRRIFSSHVVKPAEESHGSFANIATERTVHKTTPTDMNELFKEHEQDSSWVFAASEKDNDFSESRTKELNGLAEAKVFKIVKRASIPSGSRVYGTRFIDAVKKDKGKTKLKSRLVAQNYRDKASKSIPTKAPTISRLGLRIALHAAAMHPDDLSFTRDVTQAYTQSKSQLERKVYLEPPKEMNLPEDEILQAVKPLYGVPESGLHWFITYRNHHEAKLGLKSSNIDPCLLYKKKTAILRI